MKLSIICNTFNHLEITRKYLPKMIETCGVDPAKMELLINDNGSRDGVDRWLERQDFGDIDLYHLFKQQSNIGNPQGLNSLLNHARGEYIAKIDPDFIMPDKWASKAVDLINTLPDIGIVGFYWARGFTHPDLQKGEIKQSPIHFVPNKVFGCWVFSRFIIENVGCFYDQWKYGNWDSEFQERLKRNGYTNIYCREDSIHMGVDNPAERRLKNIHRIASKDIPTHEKFINSPHFDHEQFSRLSQDIIGQKIC